MRWGAAGAALVCALLGVAPAGAAELYCLVDRSLNLNAASLDEQLRAANGHGHNGWFEFWLDSATGEWRGRNIGSAALYSDGGTFAIANDGTGYRDHWVGVDAEAGRETLHIILTRAPMPFVRVARDGFVEFGTCVETRGERYIDGERIGG